LSNREKVHPRSNTKEPVHIRRNVEAFEDPYKDEEHLPERSVCRRCGDIYMSGRWYNPDQVPDRPNHTQHEANMVNCPACRKLRDHLPSGVLRLTGQFVMDHREEILNLIRNQAHKADSVNPMERVMTIEAQPDGMELTTTNEKLAQRIGRAMHKAYSGALEYKWSEDNRLARVNWHRDF
jgi:NMD protein affecting ribosome stability and mRNA decay